MLQSALAAGICAFLAASLGCWAALIRRRSAGRPLVRPAPASEAPWGFADLLVVVVLLSMFESFALAHVRARFEVAPGSGMTDWDVETRAAFLGANSLAGLAAIFLSVGWLRLRYQLPLRELGIGSAVAELDPELAADSQPLTSQGPKQERARSAAALAVLRTDVAIGSVAFFAVAPLVFGTQWLLSQFFESTHPLLELLKENPAPRFFAVSAFSAVLVAPLIEEFVFRVLLQGWIERFSGPELDPVRIVFGGRSGVVRDSADPGSGIGSPPATVRCRPAE